MTEPVRRPPGASILGAGGPVVVITGPAASFLDELRRTVPVDVAERVLARHRHHLDQIEPQIVALGVVAEKWRMSDRRRVPAPVRDITPPSEEIGTTTAAALLGCSTRNVLRMLDDGRLTGRKISGRWLIPRSHVEAARAA